MYNNLFLLSRECVSETKKTQIKQGQCELMKSTRKGQTQI